MADTQEVIDALDKVSKHIFENEPPSGTLVLTWDQAEGVSPTLALVGRRKPGRYDSRELALEDSIDDASKRVRAIDTAKSLRGFHG